jgi:hypothetical protein
MVETFQSLDKARRAQVQAEVEKVAALRGASSVQVQFEEGTGDHRP